MPNLHGLVPMHTEFACSASLPAMLCPSLPNIYRWSFAVVARQNGGNSGFTAKCSGHKCTEYLENTCPQKPQQQQCHMSHAVHIIDARTVKGWHAQEVGSRLMTLRQCSVDAIHKSAVHAQFMLYCECCEMLIKCCTLPLCQRGMKPQSTIKLGRLLEIIK